MTLTKQDIQTIASLISTSGSSLEKKIEYLDKKIEHINNQQTERILDAIEGMADSTYNNYPTREEVKKGLESFSESVTLKTS